MRLFIAEKPSVAKAIMAELGVRERKDGYVTTKTGDLVSWCFGHLMEPAEPDAYLGDDVPVNKKGKKAWREEDLPVFPEKWIIEVKPDCKKQFRLLGKLLKQCDQVVGAGDPDREGQLLIDEVLEYYGNKKPVLRYWVSAQDSESVRKGLKNLQPNSKYRGLLLSAKGRQRADWLLGYNLTRAYTLASKRGGGDAVLSVGRVQTPTLNLVAQRDLAIRNFKPVPYFVITGKFGSEQPFSAVFSPAEGQKGLDSEGRLVNPAVAREILARAQACKTAKVLKYEKNLRNADQPRAMSLADMQQFASSKWGFSAAKTLDILQSLYETHKLTSYPRTDCGYLPESQFADAYKVMSALKALNPAFSKLIDGADLKIRSKTWNDKKITAHHGLVPTTFHGDLSALSADELKVWETVARRYIAQFYPPCVSAAVSVELDVSGLMFKATGSTVIKPGFKAVMGNFEDSEGDEKAKEPEQKLPVLTQGAAISCRDFAARQEQTKAPAAFTEGTLIRAMENVHTVVEDPVYRKYLKEGDGIGTSATRAAIIDELKNKGFLEVSGKKLHATPNAYRLLAVLPDEVKSPVLTALFESRLKEVEQGKLPLAEFEKQQQEYVRREVERAAGLTVSISSGTVKKTAGAAKRTASGSKPSPKTAVKAPVKAAARRTARKA